MKKIILSLLLSFPLISHCVEKDKVFLFSYFKGNGEDGLHLAYSRDGLNFTALNNDKSFLTPKAGVSKLMRDPCIIKTYDGTFHLVWTAGWTERGIGYASSKDLINWSEQKYFMVMENESSARNCWAPEISYDKTNKNGKKYAMFVKDETKTPPQKNIRVTTAGSLYGPYSAPSEPITGKYWAEGPTSVKINDTWFVYFDKYTEKKMGAVISKDLMKWEDISEKITFLDGLRHGTIFESDEKTLNGLLNK